MRNSSSKKNNTGKSNILAQYILTAAVFVAVALIMAVAAILIVNKPVTEIVHKVELSALKGVGDITLVDEVEKNTAVDYGQRIGTIVCENKGINCNVYYGLNRASCRKGAGVSTDSSFFGEKGNTVVSGYDETYFAALKLVEKGDVITFTSDDKKISYKVSDAFLDEKKSDKVSESKQDCLVLYSVFSDYSKNRDKCFYVIADRINEEVDA